MNLPEWLYPVGTASALAAWAVSSWLDARRIRQLEATLGFMAKAHQRERERVGRLMALSPQELAALVQEVRRS